jgi:hypothetical protein
MFGEKKARGRAEITRRHVHETPRAAVCEQNIPEKFVAKVLCATAGPWSQPVSESPGEQPFSSRGKCRAKKMARWR